MGQCSYHPNVETAIRCVECDRFICPKEWVETPVGYKCPEHGRQTLSARRTVKPRQFALALAASALVGIGGSFLIASIGFRFWPIALVLGLATGEAARRASGGHRTGGIAALAGFSVIAGSALTGAGYLVMALSAAAAVISVMQNRW
ncbi:MAG: hypothetical protein ACYC6J_05325 [Coriobacteriia bacterium]